MFKKLMRGSLLISLLLIVSVSLSGCSIDIGKIVSGLTNTLGKITSGIGNFIIKAVDVAKKVVTAVKDVAGPIIKAVEDITGKTTSAADKIGKGIGKINGALDKIGNFGEKMVNTGDKLKEKGKDSAGNATDAEAPSAQTVANPFEDEDTPDSIANSATVGNSGSDTPGSMSGKGNSSSSSGTAGSMSGKNLKDMAQQVKDAIGDFGKVEVINKDGSTTVVNASNPRINTTSANDELLTKKEKEDFAKSIAGGLNTAYKAVDELSKIYKDDKVNPLTKNGRKMLSLKMELINCKNELDALRRSATMYDYQSIKKFEALNKRLEMVRKQSLELADTSAFLTNSIIRNAVSEMETAVDKVRDSILKAYYSKR